MHSKLTKYISIILAIVMIVSLMPGYQPAARAETEELAGRTLSVLGASISTYAGTSNGDAADTTNSTIRSNAKYYPNATVNDVTLEDTWWMQAADDLGLRLLVNNSWSGSTLLHTRSGTVGAYVDRCVQLHDDTGDNAGELPDIIAIQMGTNDFQYYKDTLGTADIDYAALIAANDDGTYTYSEPVTSLEAAAIVLHKIGVRYPDAEVYYLNISQRVDGTDELIQSFNAELKQVVEHFGAHIVDIYGSAITMADFDKYIGDGRAHPNKLGMDAYTEAFKEALLANTAYEAEYHKVSMNLTDVAADYGTDRLVIDGEPFEVKLSAATGDALEVKVTMGGRDITADAYKNGAVTIGAVTDDVLITAAGVHFLKSYRWEFDGGELACVSGENALTKNAGTTTDGVFSKTRYALKEAVVLNHDEAWAVEWKCEGTWQNSGSSSGARVFTTTDVNDDYNARYIFKSNTNGLIAMGEKDSKGSHNYGIALGDHDIDWTAIHTYRLENRIADDGSNMIYLSVDGEEIGAMTGYYIGTKSQNTDSDWLSGKDFVFPYMGTDTHGFTNCSIEYIAVCEGDTAHSYTSTVTLPTCTAQGYTTYTCTSCGDVYRTAWLDAAAYEGKTIACIGDSITCGVGVTKDETDYVYLLAEQLDMNYIRLGVSGTTLCTDGSRTCNISKLTEGNLNGADVVTIAMGINDFCAAAKGYYELGDINSTDSSTIYGAARMWCKRIEELRKTDSLSHTQFYFVTPVIASWNSSVTSARNWDQSKTNVHGYTLRDLCNAIIEVAALYDVPVIDLNLTSGMYYVSATDNNTAAFGGDGVHPGPNGHAMMADALANALLQNDLRSDHTHTYGSWITTKYPGCANGEEKRVCSVCTATESRVLNGTGHSYSSVVTDPTCVEQGYTTHTCECGDSYVDSYVSATGEHSYSGLTCTVCGAERETAYAYYWQNDGTNLNSITQKDTAENDLTLLQGSVRNGVLTNTQFSLENAIVLCHDQPWVIEWRSQGNWKGMLFASSRQSPSDGLTYLFQDTATRLFAFGEYDELWHNYGIVLDCDMSLFHTFRLENRITEDGSNAVYLLIDNHEIGAMHHYYVTNKNQNQTVNWANGKDLVFSNMGTSTHAVSDMQLDYLRVWEGGHEHAYQSAVTAPSCVDAGYTTYTCTQCGCSFMDGYLSPTGHELGGWIRISGSTCADGGEERRECGKCDYSETRTIEHRYEAVITPPTCTAQGYTTYTCSECGSSRTGDVTGIPVDRNINFVGMSIWYFDGKVLPEWGTGGGEVARGFQTLLKEHFAFRSTKDYCYSGYSLGALSGSDSHSIAANIESCVRTGEAGDIWTLDTNTNDFKRDIPIGTIEDYMNSTGAATFYGALRVFHDRVTELSGENVVVICSNAIRRNTSGYTSTSANACGHTLADYEAAVKTVALHNGWYFVDQFNDSGITEENLSEVTIDGLHPNNEGYKLAVRPWIEQISRFAHTYESAVTAPTCTEQGYTTYTCAECGDSYAADYVESLGHDYKNDICTVCGAYEWDTDGDGALEVLAIGNSFSVDALEYFWQIADDLGVEEIVIGNLYIGGCSLETHAANAKGDLGKYTYYHNDSGSWTSKSSTKISTALAERDWDYITLQQWSATSGVESFYNDDLNYLISYVKERSEAKIGWHMTWAYQQDSTHNEFPRYNSDQMTMYNAIVSAAKNKILTNEDMNFVIPSGTAVQNSRTSFLGDTTTRDGYHMSKDYGRYLTGLMWFREITGLSVDGINYAPSGVDSDEKAIAIESVNNAYEKPFEVTKSEYANEIPEGYILLEPVLYKGAFWHSTYAEGYNVLHYDKSNSHQFFATPRFTREELPVGSIIVIENGWQYRPEGWVTDALQTKRENATAKSFVRVTEEWWSDYTIRAFNISKVGLLSLENTDEDEVRAAFKIYVPHTHSYTPTVTPPTCTQQGYTTYTCHCGDSYVANYTEPRPLNILMIGNSFSWDAADFWYDMQESMTYDAMKNMLADSYDVHLAVMYKGSATLAYHATCAMNNTAAYTYTEIGPETNYKWTPASGNNATNSILERLEAREWDIIVIQSYQHEADGTEPRSTYTGGDSRFVEPEASTGYLLDYFAEHEPNAEIYYYMPWASTKFYGNDTEAGYRAIAEYSKNRVPEFKGTNSGKQLAGIIPVGTGIQNARTTYFDELRFSSGTGSTALLQDPQNGLQYDNQHLSFGLGRYIAGIVVAETLIPQAMRVTSYTLPAVKDSPSVGALPQEYSAIAQLAAEKALAYPYQITSLNGYETDLADRICEAIETGNYVSEEIADEAALAEYLQSVVDAYLENAGAAESEITIHSFVLENGRIKELDADVALRVGYTKRTARINVVDGQSHRFGDWIHVTAPTANEVGIDSRTCAACGFTQIVEVEGSWQKYNLAEHLQELPEKFCHKTNLWAELEPESLMIDHLGKWVSAGATVYSVTIPIAPGDKIYANSFDVTGTKKGIQVSFIGNYGIVKTTFSSGTHEEFCENGGYLIAPEGAIAVNIPVWNVNADDNVINILNAEHIYDVNVTPPTCTQQGYTTYTCACGDSYVADYVDELGHTPGEAVKENETAGGAHDSVVYCTECGNELSREHVEGKTHTPGDINGDGSVNNKDFTRLFQYLADWDVEVVEAALDVNGDGTVNNKDLTRLFQYLSDWDVVIH